MSAKDNIDILEELLGQITDVTDDLFEDRVSGNFTFGKSRQTTEYDVERIGFRDINQIDCDLETAFGLAGGKKKPSIDRTGSDRFATSDLSINESDEVLSPNYYDDLDDSLTF